MFNTQFTDALCGSNLIRRAQQALVVDQLQFGRFEELCTMLELLVLADSIYYFGDAPRPGKLTHSFRQVFHNIERKQIAGLMEKTAIESKFNRILQKLFGDFAPIGKVQTVLQKGSKKRLDDDLILDFKTKIVGDREELFQWLLQLMPARSWDNVEARYFMRAFLYEVIGRQLSITVAHDALRLPLVVAADLGEKRTNFELYWGLTSAIKQILVRQPGDLFIRPIPAVIFERCNGDRNKIIFQVGVLREYFREYREEIADYESMQDSNAPAKVKQEAISLIEEASQHLQAAARTVGKKEKWHHDLISRFISSGSIKEIAVVPVASFLKRNEKCRAQRKIGPLFHLLKELVEIKAYPSFIKKLWPSTPFARANPFHQHLESCRGTMERPV